MLDKAALRSASSDLNIQTVELYYIVCYAMQALAELAVEEERWEDAQQLVADHPELADTVCLPWAEWLVAKGSFHEARLAYRCLTASTDCSFAEQSVCCTATSRHCS